MFSAQRGFFSQIPCPYRDNCKLPNCMFLHDAHQEQPSHPTSGANEISTIPQEVQISEEDGPRKRQKLDDTKSKKVESTSTISIPAASKPAIFESSSDSRKKETISIGAPKPTTAKNNSEVSGKGNVLIVAKPLSSHATTSNQTQPPLPSKDETIKTTAKENIDTKKPNDFYSPIPKVKKAAEPIKEGLYPRMINPAPAKYEIRLRLLRMLYEHFVRLNGELAKESSSKDLLLSEQAMIILALDMEEKAATDKPAIYSNVLKNKVQLYKRMVVADWKKERQSELEAKELKESNVSNVSNSSSGVAQKQIHSIPKPIETGLSEYQELLLLHRLYADFVRIQQDKHGFVIQLPTDEMIQTSQKGLEAANNWECCERCRTRFQVFPGRRESDGVLTTNGPCEFHWGKPFWQDLGQGARGRGDRKYRCCGEAVGISSGCVKNEHHVFKITSPARLATVLQFLETPENLELEKNLGEKEVLRPVCIDGEMAFTVYGLELVRLTATSWPSGSEILDFLVRPIGEITDLNSRFSGVWPQQLANAKPWTETDPGSSADLRIVSGPIEARSLLLRFLTPKTPIVGHGLENDLNAVRLIHPTIIDTALLFPHKAGLPYRLPLKALMLEHLGRHIQLSAHSENAHEILKSSTENGDPTLANGGAGGHDSKEDANAAGDLVRLAIGKEWGRMKREGWSWRDPKAISQTSTPSSSPHLNPTMTLTPFEQHFIPPRLKLPIGPRAAKANLLTLADLEGPKSDPTIQTQVMYKKVGAVAMPMAGVPRKESSEERFNREKAEKRMRDGEREIERKRKLEVEKRSEEEIRKGTKRTRDGNGRVVVAYDDLDGACDEREDDANGDVDADDGE